MHKIKVRIFSCAGGPNSPAFWTAWITELEKAGFDVEQIYTVAYQEYRTAHGSLARLILRLKMYAGMFFYLTRFGVLSPQGSILIVTTNPFYAPWFLATFAARRRKVITLLYDLYPEVVVAAGRIKPSSLVERTLSKLTQTTIAKSHATVFLGKKIQHYVTQQYGTANISEVIPVGADCRCFPTAPEPDQACPAEILYCGNLGVLHETEAILRGLLEMDEAYQNVLHFRFMLQALV